jgi:hypothetical protein
MTGADMPKESSSVVDTLVDRAKDVVTRDWKYGSDGVRRVAREYGLGSAGKQSAKRGKAASRKTGR